MDNKILYRWKLKKLGDVCEVKGGKNQSKVFNPNGKYPIYGSSGIFGYSDEYLCDEGTTIIGRKGTINSPIYVKTKFWNVDTAFGLCSKESLDSKFLFFFCTWFNFHKLDKSTTIPSLAKRDLLSIDIPIPPLPEQQAIVSKLEELLSDLDNGKQQLLLAQQQLKVYRQSLLKWAFEGKFTNKDVKDGELPKGWKNEQLKDVAEKITDGEHFRPITQNTGIPFLSAKDVRDFGVSFDDPLFISEDTANKALQRCNPQRGDILIVSRGATVGRMCIVNTDRQFCLLGSVILIKVNGKINSKFLNYALKSPLSNQQMVTISGATAQQAIYLRDIKNIPIPLPSLAEQQLIVEELESKLTVCDKIEETISKSLEQAETLRQSILKKAFEGKLVNMNDGQEKD